MRLWLAVCLILGTMLILLSGCGSQATTNTPWITPSTTPSAGINTSVSAVPSKQTARPGDTFDVSIRINTTKPARGVQFSVRWDPAKVTCTSADQGAYFKDFAEAHGGSIYAHPSEPAGDNTIGKFPKEGSLPTDIAIAMTGAQGPDGTFLGVTGIGDVYILHMSVKEGASGTAEFRLANVILGNNSYIPNDMHPLVNNGRIAILP